MTDWDAKVRDVLGHFGSRKRTFSIDQSLKLIDFFAQKGTASKEEMQAHGSANFVLTIFGHVTTAVHGPGSLPREGGWYRHPPGDSPYIIDTGFSAAWLKARPRT